MNALFALTGAARWAGSKAFGAASAESSQPLVLLVTTEVWPTAGLLADALDHAGFKVAALCPADHPLRAVRGLALVQRYSPLRRHARLAAAIEAARPDLIVPCDDTAVALLHEHHRRWRASPTAAARIALIEQSLGDPAHHDLLRAKSAFIQLAADHGVQTPATLVINHVGDLAARLNGAQWPVVLKADGWSGGRGTRVAHGRAEALAAFEALSRPPSRFTLLKDMLREGDLRPLFRRIGQGAPVVTLQAFAPGVPVNRAVVCQAGRVLAGRTFEVVESMPNNGNATVVRPRDLPRVDAAVERCVALLGLSGLVGFDFVYDKTTGQALLLEVNPRATSACYTAPRGEADLASALFAATCGSSVRRVKAQRRSLPPTEFANPLIALFPQELERDPSSPYLASADHQAPWRQPALVAACIARAGRQSAYVRMTGGIKTLLRRAKRAPLPRG